MEKSNKEMLIHCIKSNMKYDVYEKLDGSLGILYLDPADNRYKIATRGSFQSDQAKKATLMFRKIVQNNLQNMSHTDLYERLLECYPEYKDYTLCFEIIYPENRMNDGARLVCDYGTDETLVLLGAINKVTGKDLDYASLQEISESIGLPLAKKYNYTIDQLIEMKKTLPMTEEGWVIRFENGFRCKIKGNQYLTMQRILNGITPLNLWDIMKNNPNGFELPNDYKVQIPEEILKEVNELEWKLKNEFIKVKNNCFQLYTIGMKFAFNNYPEKLEKGLGLYIKANDNPLNKSLFLIYKNNLTGLDSFISMIIRPTGNKLSE